jgi:hypothetical protein
MIDCTLFFDYLIANPKTYILKDRLTDLLIDDVYLELGRTKECDRGDNDTS